MDEMDSKAREHVCALVDGRLPEDELVQVLSALLADPQSVQAWHAYHVVGDVLRSPELAPGRSDLAFLERLERRLAEEPERPGMVATHSTAWNSKEIAPVMVDMVDMVDMGTPVANAPVFRWKMLAGVASTALFGVLALNLWTEVNPKPDTQMSALNKDAQPLPPVVVADTRAGSMIRDPRLDELMAAHRQLGGHSALQVPAGFLRNATYEGPAR